MPLTTGDAILCREGAIERKGKFQQGHDFVSSMGDGRLDDEIPRMLSTYPKSVLIIENPDAVWSTNFSHESILGMQAKLATYAAKDVWTWKIPTMFTVGIEGTARAIERLAYWTQHTPADKPVRYDRPKYATLEEYKIIQIQGAFVDCGPVLAQALLDKYKNLYNIMNALGESTISETKGGNLKWKHDGIELKGIGPAWVQKNRELCGMG